MLPLLAGPYESIQQAAQRLGDEYDKRKEEESKARKARV